MSNVTQFAAGRPRLARLGGFLAGSQPRFDDSVLKITERNGEGESRGMGEYEKLIKTQKRIKCKFYATFKIAVAMFCNLSTTARIKTLRG